MSNIPPNTFHGISLHISTRVAPENVQRFLDLMRPAYEAVIAEPECTFFEVYVSSEEPGLIHWVEGWSKDKQWLMENQLQKDYYKPCFAATKPLFTAPREFAIYEKLAPEWAFAKPEHFSK